MKNHFNKIKENLRSKEFWKRELKKINLSDILIWVAIILMFLASYQNIQAGNDPCSYCVINDGYEQITCKEYFEEKINLSEFYYDGYIESNVTRENT